MATTSEIQVTEAYIGLLGRAPDPAGLAYWAAQLDAAIAADLVRRPCTAAHLGGHTAHECARGRVGQMAVAAALLWCCA